jgi:hypothetical protein
VTRTRGRRWGLAAQATIAVLYFRVALWVFSFATVRRMADVLARLVARSSATHDPAAIARMILRAGHLVPRTSCLVRAMAAKVLLAANGKASLIHIGVAGTGESFEAHAWVECDGEVVLGGEEAGRYRTLLTLSPDSASRSA